METLEGIVAEHPFFKDLAAEHVRLITGCASNVRFEAGRFIFREGAEAQEFYLIRQGHVGLEMFAPERGHITVETLGEGDILGWSWLIPPYTWHFDARALELTRAIALDGKCLRKKCEEDHDLGYELMRRFLGVLTLRLEATRLQLVELYAAHS